MTSHAILVDEITGVMNRSIERSIKRSIETLKHFEKIAFNKFCIIFYFLSICATYINTEYWPEHSFKQT